MNYIDLPKELLLIIYSFSGNNFIINKKIYDYLTFCREKYYNNPVQIYYRLAQWKYVGEPNRTIINRLSKKMRPSIKVHNETYIDISNVSIGYVKADGNIIPSIELEKKIVPNIDIIEKKRIAYVYSKITTWNIYQCWTKEINKTQKYGNFWVSRKKLNELIIPYNINGKITN